MAAAKGLVSKLLQLQGTTRTQLSAMAVGASAGFLGTAAVASAASDEGAACPAYPWPHNGAQGGPKVFMQHDCAACHSMLPYAGLSKAAGGQVEAKAAEIVVVDEEAQPATARPLHGSAYPPDLTLITKMLEGLRHNKLYSAEELKRRMVLPTRLAAVSSAIHEDSPSSLNAQIRPIPVTTCSAAVFMFLLEAVKYRNHIGPVLDPLVQLK